MPPFVRAYRTKFHGRSLLETTKAISRTGNFRFKNQSPRKFCREKGEKHDAELSKSIHKQLYNSSLDDVDLVLDQIEKKLCSNDGKDDLWLCSDKFSGPHIYLSSLLHRLNSKGLSNRFWGCGNSLFWKTISIRSHGASLSSKQSSLQSPPGLDIISQLLLGTVVFFVVVTIFFYFKL